MVSGTHRLEESRWRSGEPVPSITTLSQEHGVARQTAAKALRCLRMKGCSRACQGSGTTWREARGRARARRV
jgi:DNA-binding GntR family transcriptional regulator